MSTSTDNRKIGDISSVFREILFHGRNRMFLCRDRVWPNGEVLYCNRAILCHDIVGKARKIFYRDGVFLGHDRDGQAMSFLSRQSWSR